MSTEPACVDCLLHHTAGDWRVGQVGEGLPALLGFGRDDLLSGRVDLRARIHAHDADLAQRLFDPRPPQPEQVVHLRLRDAGGRIRIVQAESAWAHGPDGATLRLRLWDVRRLPRTLDDAASTANFRAMMENTDDFIYFKDRHHVFTGASQTLVSLCSPAEHWTDLLGVTDYDVFPELYADAYYALEKRVFAGEPVAHEVQQTLTRDGRPGWVDNRKYPIHDAAGRIIGLFGVARDITEQKRQQEALQASERKLATIFDNVDTLVLVKGADGRLLYANPLAAAFLGRSQEALVGRPDHELVGPEVLARLHALEAEARRAGHKVSGELQGLDREGRPRWFLASLVPLSFDGHADATLGLYTDITPFKQAERAVRRLSRLYAALTQCNQEILRSPDESALFAQVCRLAVEIGGMRMAWIGLVDPGTRLVQPVASFGDERGYLAGIHISVDPALPAGRGPTGRAVREGRPQWCQDFQHDPATLPWHERGRQSGWGASASLPIRRHGEPVGALTLYAPETDAFDEDIQRLLCEMAADIGHALDNFEVRSQLRKLSLAVEQSPEGVVITNVAAQIEYVNPAFERITGYARGEVLGRNPRLLQSGRTPRATYEAMWAALGRGQVWRGDFLNRRKDGSLCTESATVLPLRLGGDEVTHYVGLLEDVTQRRAMADELERYRHHLEDVVAARTQELRETREAADTANRAKSAFIANMSHEIRTPMNAIVGMTHLLRQEGVTPAQAARLDQIDRSGQHLLSLINDILDLSKIESGRLELEQVDFALAGVLDDVLSVMKPLASAKGLALRVEAGEVPGWLNGDPTRLRQVLINYVGNAVKFTEHGEVHVSARPLPPATGDGPDTVRLCFEVADTGVGIPPERIGRLFRAFEQGDGSTTRHHGGTGLGLSINRRLAQLMGGEVGVRSVPGEGSTFWISVRLARGRGLPPAKAAPDAADPAALLRARHGGTRLLLAEDNEINAEVATALLTDAGLRVDVAGDGLQALALARQGRHALILMDVQMPNLDGLDATRAIRRLPGWAQRPIIALTANAFAEDQRACLEAGMNDFVAKPMDPLALYRVILRWLEAGPDAAGGPPAGGTDADPARAGARTGSGTDTTS